MSTTVTANFVVMGSQVQGVITPATDTAPQMATLAINAQLQANETPPSTGAVFGNLNVTLVNAALPGPQMGEVIPVSITY